MSEKVGYIKMYRQIQDSEIWNKPPEWLKIWLYILMEVNFKENGLPIGSKYMTYEEIKLNCKGVTINQIEKAVKWLKASGNISTQKATRGMVVFVSKYSQYQTSENEPKATRKATFERRTIGTEAMLYIEEGKKERRKEILSNDSIGEVGLLLEEFYKQRRLNRKPMTDRAKDLLLKKLQKLAPNDDKTQIAMLEEAILKGWQSVYPLKDEEKKEVANKDITPERRKAIDEHNALARKNGGRIIEI